MGVIPVVGVVALALALLVGALMFVGRDGRGQS